MGFAVKVIDGKEIPALLCDTCGEAIGHWSGGKAVGTKPTGEGNSQAVTFCHNDCSTSEPNSVPLADYLALYSCMLGTVKSREVLDTKVKLTMESPRTILMV